MPKAKAPKQDALTDTWGRANRKLEDKHCPKCGKIFRPKQASTKYCSRPCAWSNNGGQNAKPEVWWKNNRGYIEGRVRSETGVRRVKQHREIASQMLGRELLPNEDVHHKNGDKTDNRPENLEVILHADHSSYHNNGRAYKKGYKLNLSEDERKARSERMRLRHAAKARGEG